MNNLHKGEIV